MLAMLISMSVNAAPKAITGNVRVIDGDTLEHVQTGEKIRLKGIDAPESDQLCTNTSGHQIACGLDSTAILTQLIGQGTVYCEQQDIDAYQRWIATCWNEQQIQINAYMVQKGYALAFRKYDTTYVSLERHARKLQLGLWQFSFISPWEHRAQERKAQLASAARPVDQSCVIKGNISRDGRKLYHLPNTRHYEITSIRIEQGERYFCSEKEALDNGWQKAR